MDPYETWHNIISYEATLHLQFIQPTFFILKKGKAEACEITLLSVLVCLCSPSNNVFACVFVIAGACLLSLCLVTFVSSGSIIPAFMCHVTFHSKVVGHGLSCAVRFVYNI
jgi:hypothetical protein